MMSNEDVPRPPQPSQPIVRRQAVPRYQESRFQSQSPSFNYNSNTGYNPGNSFAAQQHPRRRVDRFKRESINYNDRMIRQNDSIIRLLKEIRDRLPPPPGYTAANAESANAAAAQDQATPEGIQETDMDRNLSSEPEAEVDSFQNDNQPGEAEEQQPE